MGLTVGESSAMSGTLMTGKTGTLSLLIVWCLCLALLLSSAPVSSRTLDLATSGDEPVSLTEYFSVLEDKDAQLTLTDVRTAEFSSRFITDLAAAPTLSYGYTRSAYWLRLSVSNSSAQPVERMIEIGYAALSSVQFYTPQANGEYRVVTTGMALPFATRAYPNHNFVFPVTLPAHSQHDYFLRVQSTSSLLVPASAWTRAAFHENERNDYLARAWYFGMASAMILFNLVLYFALRDGLYLLYVSFVAATGFALAADQGFAQEFLWPQATRWSDMANFVGYSLCVGTFLQFTRRMLSTRELAPRSDLLLKALAALLWLSPIGIALALESLARYLALSYLLGAIIVLVVAMYCLLIKRHRSAVLFTIAFAIFIGGCLVTALMYLGVLPSNSFTSNGVQFGSAVEMILLAFALADRFNQVRREKEKAQAKALLAEQQIIETLRSSEQLLESRVKERTAELSAAVERQTLMQAELVQAEKMASLGALVAGVAHELNTPIGNALITATSIDAAAKEFEKLVAGGEFRRSDLSNFVQRNRAMADLIHRSCERSAALINSFKQVAVDQTSELQRRFDLRSLAADNVAALKPSFKRKPWRINNEIAESIELNSYPGPLGQVITNLVQNAVTHAFDKRDQGTVTLSATLKGDQVELICADDGNGMSADVRDRIFEPFFTTRLGAGGSGLGLSISLNIVKEVLGGELHVTSEPGHGTRFIITLPLTAPKRAARPIRDLLGH